MKPLHVALIVKNTPAAFKWEDRNMGYWSYPVPEFTWEHRTLGKSFKLDTRDWIGKYDLIFHEDGSNWGIYQGNGLPVIYHSIDSTLSPNHYKCRYKQAMRADLILLDHDNQERFSGNKNVRQWNYCVNDAVFFGRGEEKICDISFHCTGGGRKGSPGADARNQTRKDLQDIAQRGGYTYRSGIRGLGEYALSMAQSKIVVNVPRTVRNRPHRVFDTMASGACLLTKPIPRVSGDLIVEGLHFIEWVDIQDLEEKLIDLLETGKWENIAKAGHNLIMENHTWSTRAKQLRKIIKEEFGL